MLMEGQGEGKCEKWDQKKIRMKKGNFVKKYDN